MSGAGHEVREAVVLCAGRGSRLGDLAVRTPKPMLPIAGQPLIGHIVAKLLDDAGFEDVVLVVGDRGHAFEELFRGEARVRCVRQASPLGTADALLAAAGIVADRFLLTYGDLWVEAGDYRDLRVRAEADGRPWLAVNEAERPRGAAVYLDGDRVTRIVEKPHWPSVPDTRWNASGLYVLESGFLDDCRAVQPSVRGELELTAAIQLSIDGGAAFAPYRMSQPQVDVGVPERYHALCATLSGASDSSSTDSAARPTLPALPAGG